MASTTSETITDVEAVGEQTRLIGDDKKPLKELPESTFKEKIVSGLAVVSFAASVTAIIFASTNPVVYVSGILGIGLGEYTNVFLCGVCACVCCVVCLS